jgi:hypothetical protein
MATRLELAPPQATIAAPILEPVVIEQPAADPFPYAFGINGRRPQPLTGWAQLADLLRLVGLTRDCSFLIVERTDGSERWAQAIGRGDELVVELGLPDAPMRVTRPDAAPTTRLMPTASGTVVEARPGELFTPLEAADLVRTWLESATLGGVGTGLRTPDDWQ